MKKNVGKIDLAIRLLISAVLVMLIVIKVLTGTWITVALILSSVLVLTGFVGFCPLYWVAGINTSKKNSLIQNQ